MTNTSNQNASTTLRSITKPVHEEVESALDWNEMLSTRSRYIALLRQLWRLNSPADKLIEQFFLGVAELEGRRTAAWLEQDLSHLAPQQPLPDAASVADYSFANNPSAVAGVTYVLEGSSLGGLMLAQQAEKQLGLTVKEGVTYLNGYGRQSGQRWNQTKAWLDRSLTTEAEISEAVVAAHATFHLYRQTLETVN